ncbi:MAG: hypothetical protein O3A47_12225 [Chloroflexi bacterium]|nr:hypothetical protein [Chloroflexota bacterium]
MKELIHLEKAANPQTVVESEIDGVMDYAIHEHVRNFYTRGTA